MDAEEFQSFRKTISTRFGEIAYADIGDGPAVLFVHGLFLNGLMWAPVISELPAGRRYIAVDTLGHGATRVAPGQDMSLAAQAEMLAEFCAALGLDELELVANDTGGAIAQIFAARNPDRLRTLTLTDCDTVGNCPPPSFAPVEDLARQGGLGPALASMLTDLEFARSEFGLGSGYERPQELSEQAVRAYIGPLVASPQAMRDLEAYVTAISEQDLIAIEPQLRKLTVPTLIVWGTDDRFFGLPFADWLAEAIPGTRKVVRLDGAKLFFPEERPRELADCLTEHWAAASAPPESG